MASFGVVLLAAGASSRFGSPKQLLPYGGGTLAAHAAHTALASGASQVVVVVGARSEAVIESLRDLGVQFAVNPDWSEGMGSSIRCGIGSIGEKVDVAVIALADQPHVTAGHLRALAERVEDSDQPIVASSYDGIVGAPCAFARSEFSKLLALEGDAGARSLLRRSEGGVETIAFAGANIDVDKPSDYEALVSEHQLPSIGSATPEGSNPVEAR